MQTDQVFKTTKTHVSRKDAFQCMRKHLLKSGYEQIGPREFKPPEGPVLVLNKKSHYGGELVAGKRGEEGKSGKATRFMPNPKKHGNRGLII